MKTEFTAEDVERMYNALVALEASGNPVAGNVLAGIRKKEDDRWPLYEAMVNRTHHGHVVLKVHAKNPLDAEQVALERAQKAVFSDDNYDYETAYVKCVDNGTEGTVETAEPFEIILDAAADDHALLCAMVDKMYALNSQFVDGTVDCHIPDDMKGKHPKDIEDDDWWNSDSPRELIDDLKGDMNEHAPTGFKFGQERLYWGFWPA